MTEPTLETLTPQQVKERLERGEIVLIDVREPAEYAVERIRGALLSPMSTLEVNALPSQSDKPIVFHCGAGLRSQRVAERYLASGHPRVAHMEGGLGAWKAAGLSTIALDPATGGLKNTP